MLEEIKASNLTISHVESNMSECYIELFCKIYLEQVSYFLRKCIAEKSIPDSTQMTGVLEKMKSSL